MQPQQQQKQPTREEFIQSLFLLEEKDNYLLGDQAIEKLCAGIQKGVDIISKCYGTSGINAELEHPYQPFHVTSNDGKVINVPPPATALIAPATKLAAPSTT